MKNDDLLDQYFYCLEKYFDLLSKSSKLAASSKVARCQNQILKDLTLAGNSLRNYLAPSLKEK